MLPGAFVAIPGGALGQRFGEKRIVVAGLALMALGTWMTAISSAYDMVLAGRLVSGIGAVAWSDSVSPIARLARRFAQVRNHRCSNSAS